MGVSCKIVRNNKGELTQVLNTNDRPSRLFFEAYQITQDPEKALDLWAVHDTPEYKDKFGEVTDIDSIDVNNLVSVFADITAYGKGLSPAETFEVKNIMRRTGTTTLSELHAKLKDVFFEGEAINFNGDKAISSGIFSVQDLVNLNVEQAVETVLKIEATLLKGDFYVEAEKENSYFNPNIKTTLGSSSLVAQSELEQEWVDSIQNFQDEAEVEAKLESLPYKEFVASVKKEYALFEDRVSQLKRIVVASVTDGQLSGKNTGTYATVKNTIKNNIPSEKIRNEIVYLQSILPTVWDMKRKAVEGVLREIEEDFAEYGIDVIGLSKLKKSKEEMIDFLESIHNMAVDPSNKNIKTFSEKYDKLFDVKPQTEVVRLDPKLRGLTIVKVISDNTDQELFERFGLIKVGTNLYHKVKNTETTEELYEALYEKTVAKEVDLPVQTKDKEQTIRELQSIMASKSTGLGFKNERLSLYQTLFNHTIFNKDLTQNEIEFLGGIVTDEDYLKTNFIVDLYDYVLEEKLKNSPLYKGVLSKIKFNDQDITIEGRLEDFQNMEYYQELTDYLRLRKNLAAKSLVPQELKTITPDGIVAVNNPSSVPLVETFSVKRGNLLAVPVTNQPYLRVGNEVYQALTSNENTSVFIKLKTNASPLYYTTKVEAEEYNQDQLKKSLAENLKQPENTSQQKEEAGMKKSFFQNLKDKAVNFITGNSNVEKSTDQNFQQNLVEFITRKGVKVVTDIETVKAKLASLGFESIQAMMTFKDMPFSEKPYIKVTPNGLRVDVLFGGKVSNSKIAEDIASRLQKQAEAELKAKYPDAVIPPGKRFVNRLGTILSLQEDIVTEAEKQQIEADFQKTIDEEMQRIEEEQIQKDFQEKRRSEIRRGVSPQWLRNELNFLQIPQGDVLGFEHKGVIYLDSSVLNTVTTLHELTHVFQSMIDIKASKGDLKAQTIKNKRKELFQDFADEWKAYHESRKIETRNLTNPKAVVAEDGWVFYRLPDGQYTDGDQFYQSWSDLEEVGIEEELNFREATPEQITSKEDDIREIYNLEPSLLTASKLNELFPGESFTVNETEPEPLMMLNINWTQSEEGKGDKNISARNSVVTNAANDLRAGKISNEEYRAILAENSPIRPIERFFAPSTTARIQKAIKAKAESINSPIKDGQVVGLRLDIPAFKNSNTWVVSVHEGGNASGSVVSYRSVARITDVTFGKSPNQILKIASGEDKSSIARIFGKWSNLGGKSMEEQGKNAVKIIEEIVKDKNWVQVGMNPFRHSYFYDRSSDIGRPVVSADEVVQVGGLIYAKNVVYGNWTDEAYRVKGLLDSKGSPVQFSIIGQKGAINLDAAEEATTRFNDLRLAKRMEISGETPKTIKMVTGWERGADTTWKYEILDGVLTPTDTDLLNPVKDDLFQNVIFTGEKLKDLFVNKDLYKAYPEIGKIEVVYFTPTENEIWKTFSGFVLNNKLYVNTNSKETFRNVIVHEVQHFIQELEGFAKGGSEPLIRRELEKINDEYNSGSRTQSDASGLRTNIRRIIGETFGSEEDIKLALSNEEIRNILTTKLYRSLGGEVEAVNAERRMNMSPQQKRESLIAETEDVRREDQIILFQAISNTPIGLELSSLGINLSSPAYAQRANETDEEYNERLLKEVEAYVVSPIMADKLEKLKQEDPSLWQRITDFIKNLTDYLKNQLGLQDYQGNVMDMSKEEYLEALGISILKDDYSPSSIQNGTANFEAITSVFETRSGVPIGFKYDTDMVARERFDFSKLTKIGEGSDRVVFDLGDNKVLKVAKTARGLEQNTYEGEYYLKDIVPDALEVGLNYVVVEKVDTPAKNNEELYRSYIVSEFEKNNIDISESGGVLFLENNDTLEPVYISSLPSKLQKLAKDYGKLIGDPDFKSRKINYTTALANVYAENTDKVSLDEMLKELSKFSQIDFDRKVSPLQDVLDKYELTDIMSYDILWGDFIAKRNWGIKNGRPIHLDGGTLGGIRMLDRYRGKSNMEDQDFREIYEESKRLKKQYQDRDSFTMFQAVKNNLQQVTESSNLDSIALASGFKFVEETTEEQEQQFVKEYDSCSL